MAYRLMDGDAVKYETDDPNEAAYVASSVAGYRCEFALDGSGLRLVDHDGTPIDLEALLAISAEQV